MAKFITLTELDRLKRFMDIAMSSEHDGEKLAALSKANDLLKRSGLRWTDVLSRMVEARDAPEAPVRFGGVYEREDEPEVRTDRGDLTSQINAAFDDIYNHRKGDKFIDSLREQFHEQGYLSPKQRASLFDNARKARGERV